MEFSPEQLSELRDMLNGVNVTDDHLSRGVQLTATGIEKVAKRFGVATNRVSAMLSACAAMVKSDLDETTDRFAYEADYMGNLTLRDVQSGKEIYLHGDEAFELGSKLTANPEREEMLIGEYFNGQPLMETPSENSNTYDFPYRGGLATVRFGLDGERKFQLEVIKLRDRQGNELPIDDSNRDQLDALAMKWVDKA